MSVHADLAGDGKNVTINVSGRFDFGSHQDFRKAYEQVDRGGGQYVVNMAQAEYMDSSALGMLLMLREHAGGDTANIKITNCREEIRNVLTIANFQKLFKID